MTGPVHPEAQKWIHSLDEKALMEHGKAHGLNDRHVKEMRERLKVMKLILKKDPNASREYALQAGAT